MEEEGIILAHQKKKKGGIVMKQFRRNLAYYCPVRLHNHIFLQTVATIVAVLLAFYPTRFMVKYLTIGCLEDDYCLEHPELTALLISITAYLFMVVCAICLCQLGSLVLRAPISLASMKYNDNSRPSTYMITEEYALPIVTKKAGKAYLQISFTQSELARINAKRRWHEYVVKLPAANYPIGVGSTIQICLSTRCFVEILHQLASHECVIFEVKLNYRGDLRSWPMISYYETSLLLKKMQRHEIDNIYEIPTGDIGSITLSKDELFDYERRLTGDRDYIYLNRRYFE